MINADGSDKKAGDESNNEPVDMQNVKTLSASGLVDGEANVVDGTAGYKYDVEVLHATNDIYWAELKVEYSHQGGRFYCNVLAYRARGNAQFKGDVEFYLSIQSGAGEVKRLTENAIQDGEWHDLPHSDWIDCRVLPVTIGFDYIYDRQGVNDKVLKTYVIKEYKPYAPTLRSFSNYVSSTFDVSGSDGISGHTLSLVHRGIPLASKVLPAGGNWSLPVTVDSEEVLYLQAYQSFSEYNSERTATLTVFRARMTSPVSGPVLLKDLIFKGTAAPNTDLRVVDANNPQVFFSDTVTVSPSNRTWQALPTQAPPSGQVSVAARIVVSPGNYLFTQTVNFTFMGLPEILNPPASSIQDQSFLLEGKNGLKNARFRVLPDLKEDPVGSDIVRDEGGLWDSLVTVPPGPVNLVVEQELNGVFSGRGALRAFRIRPPTLNEPNVTFSGTTVTFSGNGYYDNDLKSEIQFTVDDGPVQVPTPANAEVMPDGTWLTTVLDWPIGTYKVTVVQKIADNASGWIESHPCQFEVESKLPQVTEVSHTPTYRPVFSGRGLTGATVLFRNLDDQEFAPDKVVANGRWSSAPPLELGPTKDQIVVIHQTLHGQSAEPLKYVFSIPPLAPGLNDPQENGQSPIFTGTCWPGAAVVLAFNGEGSYRATTQADNWRYEKPDGFAPGEYTVSVYQTAAAQDSPSVTKNFAIRPKTPQIATPDEGAEVGKDYVVTGTNGMAGASMQLRDAQYGHDLGQALLLTTDGFWSISLTDQPLRHYTIEAQQKLGEQVSERSEMRGFHVVVLAPEITVPQQNGKMPRDGQIQGTGWYGAFVEIWDLDADVLLASDIEVQPDNSWCWKLKQTTGHHQISARQMFKGTPSRQSPTRDYRVVPNAPSLETPTAEDHVGRQVWVCGFGVPGDNVLATLGDAQGQALVQADRSWSVLLTLSVAGGNHTLQVIASSGEFHSDPTVQQVVVGTYLPGIEAPQPGRRVDREVYFRGHGRHGEGRLVSWFNPDVIWLAQVPVTDQWQGQSGQPLPPGGNWCWFHQTLTDVEGETVSERVLSSRFDVNPAGVPTKRRRTDPTSGT